MNDVNPYAPSSTPDPIAAVPISFEDALQRIRRPARFLVYMSAVNLVLNTVIQSVVLVQSSRIPPETSPPPPLVVIVFLISVSIVSPLLSAIAAACVGRTRHRPLLWARVATVTGLIPVGTLAQLPVALWLLHLLLKPEIRAALSGGSAGASPSPT
jgi:hypothetical protein